ncbi:hypothetical protein AAMO2058_000855100 [Amorphochlora amoebiformis]
MSQGKLLGRWTVGGSSRCWTSTVPYAAVIRKNIPLVMPGTPRKNWDCTSGIMASIAKTVGVASVFLAVYCLFIHAETSNVGSAVHARGSRTLPACFTGPRRPASVAQTRRSLVWMNGHHVAGATAFATESPVEILESAKTDDGREKQTFGFRITGNDKKPLIKMTIEAQSSESELIPFTVGFPGLGVVLEQKIVSGLPRIVVDAKESKGTAIDVLEEGDILRAFSAVYTVSPPTDTLAFYANPPRKVNVRGMYDVDAKNFAKTIAALQSNGEMIDRFGEKMEVNDISLVVERKRKELAEEAQSSE